MDMTALWTTLAVVTFLTLCFRGRAYAAWVAGGALALVAWATSGPGSWAAWTLVSLAFVAAAVGFGIPAWRSSRITRRLMPRVARMLPRLGETERIALEAGTVGWDAQLFSGAPDWSALFDFQAPGLSRDEQAFLDGPVEELCQRLDDWEIHRAGDLPPEVWDFLRQEGFFGLIIPESHGGRGFSAQAHAAVITKLASRSVTAAVTVMVPNSLGPAELLLHYGSPEQRDHYLPRLARGDEIPCFALTGPEAGSDAAATQSEGVVCRGEWQGEEVLGMRLHWRKRYITLAPIATLIGLAFRLRDPDGLLGDREDLGITCALIPSDLPGIEIGARHDPGVPFQNGPTTGENVFVPLSAIIGETDGIGEGWKMLMESLSAGRAISLPSVAAAGSKLAARVVSAYAMVREQFDTPIGRFEGVEEPLARIAGLGYAIDAGRSLTVAAIDAGEKPAVLSAITKAYCTDAMRDVVNDAMDIRAGVAIMRGPRNILGRVYDTVPIGITVEGANILTRSMIIYGQGAIRCHPFALEEMRAVAADDLEAFDRALFGHLGFVAATVVRTLLLGLSGGRLERAVPQDPLVRRLCQRLGRASAAFALVSEAAMMTLGGELKRREKITGRLADALAWLYLGSAVVKRFHDQGRPDEERAFADWAGRHALSEIDEALAGVLRNLPARPVAWLLWPLVFPLGRRERGPDDARGSAAARALVDDAGARDRLTAGIFLPPAREPGLGRLEEALRRAKPALEVEKKIRRAVAEGRIDHAPGDALAVAALEAGVITEAELELRALADEAREEAIQVDAFDAKEFPGARR